MSVLAHGCLFMGVLVHGCLFKHVLVHGCFFMGCSCSWVTSALGTMERFPFCSWVIRVLKMESLMPGV